MLEIEVGKLFVYGNSVWKVEAINQKYVGVVLVGDEEEGESRQHIALISFALGAEEFNESTHQALLVEQLGSLELEAVPTFNPQTEFILIFGDYEIVGYSEKDRQELYDFIKGAADVGFTVKDIDGIPNAVVAPGLVKKATLILTDL